MEGRLRTSTPSTNNAYHEQPAGVEMLLLGGEQYALHQRQHQVTGHTQLAQLAEVFTRQEASEV